MHEKLSYIRNTLRKDLSVNIKTPVYNNILMNWFVGGKKYPFTSL